MKAWRSRRQAAVQVLADSVVDASRLRAAPEYRVEFLAELPEPAMVRWLEERPEGRNLKIVKLRSAEDRRRFSYQNMNKSIKIIALGTVVAALVGCGGSSSSSGGSASTPTASTTSTSATAAFRPNVDAGFKIDPSTDVKPYQQLVAASIKYGHRGDPFSLTKEELDYDRTQNAERIMASMGGFAPDEHQEKIDDVQPPVQEPQPYRRLAGIIVGDSVLALIDMGNGQLEVIRPGQKIENSPWTVQSIDQDKAVLHRDGNVAPHTVTVRLETPPSNFGGGSTGFSGAPTGGAPGGFNGPGGKKGPQGMGFGGGGVGPNG